MQFDSNIMDTTGPVDEIIHAATIISSTVARINIQNLLSHQRQQLQSALDSLERALQSPMPSHGNIRKPDTELQGPSSSSSFHSEHIDTLDSTTNENSQQAKNNQNNDREALETLSPAQTPHQQSPSPNMSQSPIEETVEPDVKLLMTKLQKQSKKIRSFINQNEHDALSQGQDWTGLDPRLVDIKLVTRGGSSLTAKFRAGLARYSFASDYLDWAQKRTEKPRHELLIKKAKDADNRGSGYVSKYLDEIGQNTEVAQKAIQYGLKYCSFEYIYGSCGVSAFLFFVFAAFRHMPYGHLQSLATSIRASEWSTLAKAKAPWISECLSIYVKNCNIYRERQFGRKRSLEPECLEQRQNKRMELAFPANATIETTETSEAQDVSLGHAEMDPPQGRDETTLSSDLSQFVFDPFEWDWAFLLQPTSELPPEFVGQGNGNPNVSGNGDIVASLPRFNPPVSAS